MWEIEYEQREAEAYERHLNEQYDAWAQAHECVDVAAHHLRARRRSLGPAALVPAAWLLTHPEAPIRWRLAISLTSRPEQVRHRAEQEAPCRKA